MTLLSKDATILGFNQYQKSNKAPSIFYADFESSSTTKIGEHIPSRYSKPMTWVFVGIENKHDVYRGKDYMKTFCESLKENTMKIIKFQKVENDTY